MACGDRVEAEAKRSWRADQSLGERHSVGGVPSRVDRFPDRKRLLIADVPYSSDPPGLIGHAEPITHVAAVVDGLLNATLHHIVIPALHGFAGQRQAFGPYHERDLSPCRRKRMMSRNDPRQSRHMNVTDARIDR